MFKKHMGKTIGLFISQLVLFSEAIAMSDTIDVTQLHGTELYVVVGFYVFQTIVGIYFGNRYDRKTCVKDLIYQLKSKDFATSTFEKIAALVDRDPDSRLTIYLLRTKQNSQPQQKAAFEQLLVEETRKSDIIAKWSNDEYLIIAVENAVKPSTMIERIRQNSPVSFLVGYATYPVEGEQLQQLLQVAKERMYATRTTK
ncbi:Stand-alone sensor domain-containing protein [Anoxybacillus gonensis]|uniref:Stand-alone sensor domain-containing protein n=1 Tax=Anoxybacillus gonensis TaxID=198467 RepID=A0AAW7TL22_9BACL|nr:MULTISPECIES: Stand-alone sensor domain-containing protein [Anoxybacillus]AKS38512.1 Stand-alone sensor domain-containing protein [Anoxybacillus gonensis]EMI11179.1 Stand-alone sensor domain-containing protein [Anoxybacillus gonensis]KGP59768.1 Stand-alone sensor domain-containing protein [Anoxybacillus gonensis]MCQ5365709.1 Stand-alone sensor domain-containing protein [Anoxybacillus gonensis]MDO0878276.1 Stand-alone sensor domain-containing protein [Anoxybacillus gonensis]